MAGKFTKSVILGSVLASMATASLMATSMGTEAAPEGKIFNTPIAQAHYSVEQGAKIIGEYAALYDRTPANNPLFDRVSETVKAAGQKLPYPDMVYGSAFKEGRAEIESLRKAGETVTIEDINERARAFLANDAELARVMEGVRADMHASGIPARNAEGIANLILMGELTPDKFLTKENLQENFDASPWAADPSARAAFEQASASVRGFLSSQLYAIKAPKQKAYDPFDAQPDHALALSADAVKVDNIAPDPFEVTITAPERVAVTVTRDEATVLDDRVTFEF